MRMTPAALLSVLLLTSSCSFMLNHDGPRYTPERILVRDSCRQSNWPAGTDLLFVAAGGIAATLTDDAGDPVTLVPGLLVMGITGASMVYGFLESAQCRHAHAAAGYPVHGGNDWLIPPGLLLAGLGVALLSQQPRGGTAREDLCEPGEPITALCRDGTLSCSQHRRGTCAYHGGVRAWYRKVPL